MIAELTIAPFSGTLIKPEACRRIYWTKVSINTNVWGIGMMLGAFDAVSSTFVSFGG